jgi:hypothetical protein
MNTVIQTSLAGMLPLRKEAQLQPIANGELFLFNGDFRRLNYRKHIITLFKVHSLD